MQTVAVANLLVTTDRADPELTERFTRTVINSRDRIGREVHPAQLVDLRTAIYTDPLPLHEGARRYYRVGQARRVEGGPGRRGCARHGDRHPQAVRLVVRVRDRAAARRRAAHGRWTGRGPSP